MLRFKSKLVDIFFVGLAVVLISIPSCASIKFWLQEKQSEYVAKFIPFSIPEYNGPCTGVVNQTNDTYLALQKFTYTHFPNNKIKIQSFKDMQVKYLIPAVNSGQFCEDPEADGRLLYMAATFEFTAMVINADTPKHGTELSLLFYQEADELGYNKTHPIEAIWLKGRIERWALKAHMKVKL
jgi:hypothetical protein